MADDTITIRLNKQERDTLEAVKHILGTKNTFGEDSKTIKYALNFTKNVTRNLFGDKIKILFNE